MRYLPKSPAERQEMLAAIGVKSIEELFSTIPEAYRLKKPLNLPGPLSEAEVIDYFQERGGGKFRGVHAAFWARACITTCALWLRTRFCSAANF